MLHQNGGAVLAVFSACRSLGTASHVQTARHHASPVAKRSDDGLERDIFDDTRLVLAA